MKKLFIVLALLLSANLFAQDKTVMYTVYVGEQLPFQSICFNPVVNSSIWLEYVSAVKPHGDSYVITFLARSGSTFDFFAKKGSKFYYKRNDSEKYTLVITDIGPNYFKFALEL